MFHALLRLHLLSKNASYYTGYTKDVDHRIEQHKKSQGSRIARIHEVQKVVHKEKYGSRSETSKRERKINSLSHKDKQRLQIAREQIVKNGDETRCTQKE